MLHRIALGVLAVAVFSGGFWSGRRTASAARQPRVFELRTYKAQEGKLDALQARFRNHTTRLFQKHGMTNIGYWVPQEPPLKNDTLIYILAHDSREAARKSWEGFRNDPTWKRVREESERGGRLTSQVDSIYLDPVDYSPMK